MIFVCLCVLLRSVHLHPVKQNNTSWVPRVASCYTRSINPHIHEYFLIAANTFFAGHKMQSCLPPRANKPARVHKDYTRICKPKLSLYLKIFFLCLCPPSFVIRIVFPHSSTDRGDVLTLPENETSWCVLVADFGGQKPFFLNPGLTEAKKHKLTAKFPIFAKTSNPDARWSFTSKLNFSAHFLRFF